MEIKFVFWAIIILAVHSQSEAKIWHTIRDFFFPRRICTTTECEEAAQRIIDNRNATVNPCENFYEFTCGGWMAQHPVPENKTKYNLIQEIGVPTQERIKNILEKENEENDPESTKKARQVYRACLSSDDHTKENMKFLLDRLAVWGGWPIATEYWDESKFDWRKLLVNLKLTNDLYPLLEIKVGINESNTSELAVVINQGAMYFCYDHLDFKNDLHLEKWIKKLAVKIAKAANQTVTEKDMAEDVQKLIELETVLCQALKTPVERQDRFRLYNPKTLKELQTLTDANPSLSPRSKVDWVALLKDILAGSEIDVNENYQVIVQEPEYILKMLSIIDKTSPRTIANYMLWQKIARFHAEISEEFRRTGYEYSEDTTGASDLKPRWHTCVQYLSENWQHAIGYEYAKLYFSEEEKKKAQELVQNILKSYIEDLKEIDWMEAETRSLAIEKARNMFAAVGYPDWYNKTNLEEYYKNNAVSDFHLINLEHTALFGRTRAIKMLGKPLPKTEFFGGPAIVDAYYVGGVNMIRLPAGIFQYPFYVKGRPEAMNYGGVGMAIAHEISHAFDVNGRLGDKDGNLVQWWDNKTLNRYLVKQKCVEEQYEKYPLLETNDKITKLNGLLTVSENIADIGGIQKAFQAYKRYVDEHGSERRLPELGDYTPEQLFFIGYATVWCESSTPQSIRDDITRDLHTPKKYRVLVSMGNSKEFADTWRCRDSDSKVTRKCTFW